MALTPKLQLRQSQSLVMTPQLMQAIKLLQLSNLDLSAFVEEELERNPLLERGNDGPEPPVAGEPAPDPALAPAPEAGRPGAAGAAASTGRWRPPSASSCWRSPWRSTRCSLACSASTA